MLYDELWAHLPQELYMKATVAWRQGTAPRKMSWMGLVVMEARPQQPWGQQDTGHPRSCVWHRPTLVYT